MTVNKRWLIYQFILEYLEFLCFGSVCLVWTQNRRRRRGCSPSDIKLYLLTALWRQPVLTCRGEERRWLRPTALLRAHLRTHTHSHMVRYAHAHEHTNVDGASLSLGRKTQPHQILLKRGLQAYSFLLFSFTWQRKNRSEIKLISQLFLLDSNEIENFAKVSHFSDISDENDYSH